MNLRTSSAKTMEVRSSTGQQKTCTMFMYHVGPAVALQSQIQTEHLVPNCPTWTRTKVECNSEFRSAEIAGQFETTVLGLPFRRFNRGFFCVFEWTNGGVLAMSQTKRHAARMCHVLPTNKSKPHPILHLQRCLLLTLKIGGNIGT